MNSSEINQLFSNAIAKQRYHLLEEELVDLIAISGIKTSLESNLTNDGCLLRIKNTREFGMIIQAGVGGKNAELYTQCLRKGQALVSSSTTMLDGATFLKLFKHTLAYKKLNESFANNSETGIDKTLTKLFSNFIEI